MKGVAGFLRQEKEGMVSLILNDVEELEDSNNPNWRHIGLFTSNSYDLESLKDLALTKEQFAEIGENLIIRLLALDGHIK
ncbi:MAG: hypothetical protein MI976_14990 [Pseudomonadales bacterium]|nr:hypothetical protein [Pseudomonadales bacterium]